MEADYKFHTRSARVVQCTYGVSTGSGTPLGVTVLLMSNFEKSSIHMTPDEARKLARSLLSIADDADRYREKGNM